MIQEIFFTPLNANKIANQMNNAVSLRYDTENEQLQLVDNNGEFKTVSVDTTEDMNTEDISAAIADYIQNNNIGSSNLSAGNGISINDDTVTIDETWLGSYINGLGYVKVDNDTTYSADNNTLLLDGTTFSINTGWLDNYIAANENAKGPKGDTGEQGPQGDKGQTGQQGPQGQKGDQGQKGQKGDQGQKGQTGQQGPQGQKGDKGDKGDKGQTGQQGPQGQKGDQGQKGQTGQQGPKGDKGDQGQKGDKGDTGDTIEYTAGTGIGIENNVISLTATIPTIPTGVAAFANDANYATTAELQNEFDTVYSYADGAYDLINEKYQTLSSWVADNDTLMRKQDLEDQLSGAGGTIIVKKTYADDKVVISSVVPPTDLSAFTNSPGYLTAVPADYATKAQIEQANYLTMQEAANTYAPKVDIPTGLASWASGVNSDYIASLGFRLSDNDTQYGVVSAGGLTVTSGHDFAIDTNWMDARLTDYALKSELPTSNSGLTNDANFVTSSELDIIAAKVAAIESFLSVSVVTTFDGNVNKPDQTIFIETNEPLTSDTSFTGKNITVTELVQTNSRANFYSSGDISLTNLSSEGTTTQANNGNAQILCETDERVVITNSDLAQNGYNCIEIGWSKIPKSVLIDGVNFDGNISNNAISIYQLQDEAVVTISNCTFKKVSNPLRISNKTNVKFTVNFVNCKFIEMESYLAYTGVVLCQDCTSENPDTVASNNLFAPDKVIINFTNCTKGEGDNEVDIIFTDRSEVCGTADVNQLVYVYADHAGAWKVDQKHPDGYWSASLIAYDDGSKFPSVNCINN